MGTEETIGSLEQTCPDNGDHRNRLHGLVRKLEEDNNIPPIVLDAKISGSQTPGNTSMEEPDDILNTSDLEHSLVLDIDDEVDYDKEESWLFESPRKSPDVPKSSWMKENITTPELLRVRGALSARLEVLAIESRQGQYDKIQQRKSSRHSRHGSTGSLDWDYDEDEISVGADGDTYTYEDMTMYDDFSSAPSLSKFSTPSHTVASQIVGLKQGRGAWTDPLDNRPQDFDDEDDLLPMQLEFNDNVKPTRRVAPNPTIVKHSNPNQSYSVSGAADHVDIKDFIAKPTGAVKPRRSHSQDSGLILGDGDGNRSISGTSSPVRRSIPSKSGLPTISKAVPRRAKPADSSGSVQVRRSGEGLGVVRPRGSGPSSGLKSAKASSVGDLTGVVKRRGATPSPRGNDGMVRPRTNNANMPATLRT